MLKKFFTALSMAFCLSSQPAAAQENIKKLPAPQVTGGIPLMEAIQHRKSTREFSAKKIDDQTLSEILYVAWGISHDGKRTIPTSMNKQDLAVYAVTPQGVWLYDAENNQLKQISSQDVRSLFNQQDYMNDAQLTLVFTGSDPKNSLLNAAAAYQNVGLYAASRGLNNVVRGWFDHAGVAKVLGLDENQVLISQTIGWPYM